MPSLSEFAENALYVGRRLLLSTGKAAWILGTSFLIVVLPVIVEMDREAQAQEFESQQMGVLTDPQLPGAPPPPRPAAAPPMAPQKK